MTKVLGFIPAELNSTFNLFHALFISADCHFLNGYTRIQFPSKLYPTKIY